MTDTCEHTRRKRYQVFSLSESGVPMLVDGFDLPQDAQRCVDRITRGYEQIPKELNIRRPKVYMVDTRKEAAGSKYENA